MLDLSIVIPARNEEDSISSCVEDALSFLNRSGLTGEVIVIDNNSTDKTRLNAMSAGARIYLCKKVGYGSAIRCGIKQACGDYVIIGDGDGSYDFSNLDNFIAAFKQGYDIVVGNRLNSSTDKGSLPWFHKLGVYFLSSVARWRCGVNLKDYHCGLRGGKSVILKRLKLDTTGFEFATEFIMKASGYKVGEVDIQYRRDKRTECRSKLRPIRDGLRHLWYIVTYKKERTNC